VRVLVTRFPHRLNQIGITLVRPDCVVAVAVAVLHVSRVDLVDGTPMINVKP
jgi:tRNA (Thr-GGU) A37 N-methylase